MNKGDFIDLLESRFEQVSGAIRDQWSSPLGTNTRHFVIDDLLPEDVCLEIYESFPRDGHSFYKRKSFRERKRTSANLDKYDPILGEITYAFQDEKIVKKIAALTDMENIEPDPKLYAGGLSMMFKGDFLNPHIDNSHDSERKKLRRLNLLYYVSPDWKLEDGGNFELWNEDITCPKTFVSKFNRLIVMETNKTSVHSVSPVLTERPRCCISNYYFSNASKDNQYSFHVTSFTGRPHERAKRFVGFFDNSVRNVISKLLGIGRGKRFLNQRGGNGK